MTQDLANRKLFIGIAVSLCAATTLLAISLALHEPWASPGGAVGQSAAILGAGLLALSAVSVMLKRFGSPARQNFTRHIWLGNAGFVLVALHTGGNFLAPPALLLLALLVLMGLGVWARTTGAQRMATTFGSKSGVLTRYDPQIRARLETLIERKRSVLAGIDPHAQEATFSLLARHWLASPVRAHRYHRLVHAERSLLGTDRSVGLAQAYWRRIHRLIAVAFITGLLVHIIVVTFFAGYVAEGRVIDWWHLTAWDF